MKKAASVALRILVFFLAWSMTASVPAMAQVPGTVQSPALNSPLPVDGPTAVVFYADPAVSATLWPGLFARLHTKLAWAGSAGHLPTAPLMTVAGHHGVSGESARVIAVHLLGRCDQPHPAWRPLTADAPLGWVYSSEGLIQPFVFVYCTRIAEFIAPLTVDMSDGGRADAMDTAIARVLLHKWIHISLQTAEHTGAVSASPVFPPQGFSTPQT